MKSLLQGIAVSRLLGWALCALLVVSVRVYAQTDPLPSWNDGPAKQAIIAFVQATTDQASPKFVPPAERIATFDQDGTLWVEHPMYTRVMFALDRVQATGPGRTRSGRTSRSSRALRRPGGDGEVHAATTW